MSVYLGTRAASSTVRFSFTTHDAAGANVAPLSAFEAADLVIYKDGSATQRTSANGITMTSPFDSRVGCHHVDIDLADNTDAGFYAAGSFYEVWLCPDETVDGETITGRVLAYFDIGVLAVNVTQFGGTAGTFSAGRPEVNTTLIEGSDATNQIRDAVVDDATRIDASALNTASATSVPAILADTNELQTDWANGGRLDVILDARASQASVDDVPTNAELATALTTALTTAVSDSVPSLGNRPSVAQGIYMLVQWILERDVTGTTMTVKKPNGSTTLFQMTLDDDTNPTNYTRSA